jgi:hypothetical protein
VMPPIGEIEHLGLRGPHGTIPVRVYHPSTPGRAPSSARTIPSQAGRERYEPTGEGAAGHARCERVLGGYPPAALPSSRRESPRYSPNSPAFDRSGTPSGFSGCRWLSSEAELAVRDGHEQHRREPVGCW